MLLPEVEQGRYSQRQQFCTLAPGAVCGVSLQHEISNFVDWGGPMSFENSSTRRIS